MARGAFRGITTRPARCPAGAAAQLKRRLLGRHLRDTSWRAERLNKASRRHRGNVAEINQHINLSRHRVAMPVIGTPIDHHRQRRHP